MNEGVVKYQIRSGPDLQCLEEIGLDRLYPGRPRIAVAMASCGRAAGSESIFRAIGNELERRGMDALLVPAGCPGLCSREPLVTVLAPGTARIYYSGLTPDDAGSLVSALAGGEVYLKRALGAEVEDHMVINDRRVILGPLPQGLELMAHLDFYRPQVRLATRNCGCIDPFSIEEYIGRGGYRALAEALDKDRAEIIGEINNSGLRGRGGAGFPTGVKWEVTAGAGAGEKYIICNGDEGDPGAYMDRSILEGDPHSVLEGMIIGAYCLGASHGIIYVRAEYPLAVKTMRQAISQAREQGLLGDNIMNSGISFDVEVVRGAGAFVCGEETALIASIEGWPGEPRPRPPYPAREGLWGKPTCINNVETLANIPVIVGRGSRWFEGFGTGGSRGTKVFALVGKVKNSGLIEVPMGTTVGEIVLSAGGGPEGGKSLKAVQTGGPSGGCIPASMVDLPVDYESLTGAGTIMGSGGMVVMDEGVCMVDMARYFMSFVAGESCGKCTPCREGTAEILNILNLITLGQGRPEDLDTLAQLSRLVRDASLCGLGQTATNPVLSTLRYFRDEYEAHVKYKYCPAGVCRNLAIYRVDPDLCTGCGLCAEECPVGAIRGLDDQPRAIDRESCTRCGACREMCPQGAVFFTGRGISGDQDDH
ncbi:MAG: NADH-ubiquinone oxidoreductase-F iron-sulfur binding region domain-containing protein [Bacillota bacterium]